MIVGEKDQQKETMANNKEYNENKVYTCPVSDEVLSESEENENADLKSHNKDSCKYNNNLEELATVVHCAAESTQKLLNEQNTTEAFILQLPEMVLEDIFSNLSLMEISNLTCTCKTFHYVISRMLRLTFKNLVSQIESVIEELEINDHNENIQIYTQYIALKILQSDLLTLRAACARQVESGLSSFPGKILEKYLGLIVNIKEHANTVISELNNINKVPLEYFDSSYDKIYSFRNMKLFGLEVLEIFNIAMNLTTELSVLYDPSCEDGSCFISGHSKIENCSELKSMPLKFNTLAAKRKAVLMYARYITRTNNCDVIIRKLRECSNIAKGKGKLKCPILKSMNWTLKEREKLSQNYMYESYKKNFVEIASDDNSDCTAVLQCEFQFICPKSMEPLGLQFLSTNEVNAQEREFDSELQIRKMLIKEFIQKSNMSYSKIISMLEKEEYIFKMSIKLSQSSRIVNKEFSKEDHIHIVETNICNSSGDMQCVLDITGKNSTF